MDKEVSKIYSTTDYDKFKMILGNRALRLTNVSAIQKSSSEEQLMIPILVNENYEIIDGQHRFRAWKSLNIPILYTIVEGYNLAQVRRANQNSINWTISDFFKMHSDLENTSFKDIQNIMDKHNLIVNGVIKLIAKITNSNQVKVKQDIIHGTLQLSNDELVRINIFLEHFQDFDFYAYFKDNTFVSAFLDLYFYSEYDHQIMASKLEKNRHFLSNKFRDKHDALNTLTRLYSYGVVKNKIYYDTNTKRLYVPRTN